MKLLILSAFFGYSQVSITKPIECYIHQKDAHKIRGTQCTLLDNGLVAVTPYLVDEVIYVHPTRVQWVKSKYIEKELLMPLSFTK